MVRMRAQKVANVINDVPDLEVDGDQQGDLLVVGWGGTYGTITESVKNARAAGYNVSQAHFKHLNPMPKNTKEVLSRFNHVLIPELNMGQLTHILRANYCLTNIHSLKKVKGLPFRSFEIQAGIADLLGGNNGK